MSALLVFAAIPLLALSGLPALLFERKSAAGQSIATILNVLASAIGLCGVVAAFAGDRPKDALLPWGLPIGRAVIGLDALGLVFLAPIFLISGLGAVYGTSYWAASDHVGSGRKLRVFWGLMTASMATQVVVRDAVLFLIGWEVMALSAFFLITTDDEEEEVRSAGLVYLVTTHLGTLSLLAMFAILRSVVGSFALWPSNAVMAPGIATAVFVLACLGFGLKAGVMPLHIWLPGAHANAPSHVSAIMSGVLIKMGIYGLIRVGAFLAQPPAWWGGVLLAAGIVSAVFGIAFAIGQGDIKRALAYSSIENIGIIVGGIGLAVLGRSAGRTDWIALGLGGALLHVWNHALFKPLMFLCAGSILHGARTRRIDLLGGLGKRMPWTFCVFVAGAVAICGLPPLNGFVSEVLIYVGLFRTVLADGGAASVWAAVAAPALALTGALAVVGFVKLVGAVFLGAPRSALSPEPHDPSRAMLGPMIALALACCAMGILPAVTAPLIDPATASWAAGSVGPVERILDLVPLGLVAAAGAVTVALTACGIAVLRVLSRRREVRTSGTWGCGYARPTVRMQYTGSSFSQALVALFSWILFPRIRRPRASGPFPPKTSFASEAPDTVLDRGVLPALRTAERALGWFRVLQQGQIHAYLVYVVVILVVLVLAA